MALDDEWAADYQRRLNDRLFGTGGPYHYPRQNGKSSFFRGPSPDYVIFDEAFGNIGHPGKYRDAYGNPRYGPPSLARVFRCLCGESEAEHDDEGRAFGIGAGCGPRTPDPLKEMIKSWL